MYEDEKKQEGEADHESDREAEEEAAGDDKWIKSKEDSKTDKYVMPVELPFELQAEDGAGVEIGDLLEEGEVVLLDVPPYAFEGEMLDEREVDEQAMESIDAINYTDKKKILKHLVGLQYDSAGYPLLQQQNKLLEDKVGEKEVRIGKLVTYDDGSSVLQIASKSYDLLASPPVRFLRTLVACDDSKKTYSHVSHLQQQYALSLRI